MAVMRKAFALVLLLAACSLGTDATDDSSPQVAIQAPLPNAVVGGQVNIQVAALDDFGVDEVRILIDGVELSRLFTAPFSTLWNTVQLTNGSSHVIRAEARDVAGNVGIHSVTVTVQNGPQ
jgi:hypothetical protein